MASKKPALHKLNQAILDLLKSNPQGLSIYEIRELIPDIEIQQHLDRRVRDLRQYYNVPSERRGRRTVYVYKGERQNSVADSGTISGALRAKVLHTAHGRCQMCGRTVNEDGIRLQIDHKIPRNWGGATVPENLWAICELCNNGKRDFFATFDDVAMRQIMQNESVYARIAETLRTHLGKATPSWLLEFVANAQDWQEDWQKRLRELRYPPIGLKIVATRRKLPSGRWEAVYQMDEWKELPTNHKFLIKDYERQLKRSRTHED